MIPRLFLLFVVVCSGCESQEVRKDVPLSHNVARLGIVLTTDTPHDPFLRPVLDSLSRHLVEAGYLVVQQNSKQAQVIGTLSVTNRQEASIIQFSVNGRQAVNYSVSVQLTLFGRDHEIVDQLKGEFSAKYGQADDDATGKIVSELHTRGRLDAYSRRIAHADAERARQEARERETEERLEAERRAAEEKRQEAVRVAEARADDEEWTPGR